MSWITKITQIDKTKVKELQAINIQTFTETFARYNTAENMQQYVEECLSEEQLLTELNNPDSQFYFAMHNHEPVGYLKLNVNNAQTEKHFKHAIEIERIYVLQHYQGKKIGKALMQQSLSIARDMNAAFIWLGVWEKNNKAIEFYKKMGFTAFDTHLFRLGSDIQTDILMKKNLH